MCRIITISGKIDCLNKSGMLCEFQRLGEYGKVPNNSEAGHKDGWGIVAYEEADLCLFDRNNKSALEDKVYLKTVEKLENKNTDIIIGHLRKVSIGAKNINNTHPFVEKNYSFCQNGTIFESEAIPLENKFKKIIKGSTDSERFFVYILQILNKYKKSDAASVRKAIKKAVGYLRKNFDFTAVNMVFSDGKYIWGLREINVKNKFVKEENLSNYYYSLFFGEGDGYSVISSEKLGGNEIKWRAMENHELVELDAKNKITKKYII